jgi:hypothetical protein
MILLLLLCLSIVGVASQCTSALRTQCLAQRCCGTENVLCGFIPDPGCNPRCQRKRNELMLALADLLGPFDEETLLTSNISLPSHAAPHLHDALATQRKRQNIGECYCRNSPVACVIGAWGEWSTCSAPCGSGTRSRSRPYTPATCGGACADARASESETCNPQCCPQDCQIGAWSAWSSCSPACGAGSQQRTRAIVAAQCGGACSESSTSENQPCNNGCCAVACQVTEWSAWSACPVTCGGGTHSRSRSVQTAAVCGGAACPSPLSEQQACGTACCPADCVQTAWSSWSACSATCGAGTQTRTRSTRTPASCGGTCNDLTSEARDCLNAPCAPPGLPCADYRACQDCTDRGKTSPRACVYCSQQGASGGVCQSMHTVEGDSSSGVRACPSAGSRATTIGECPASPTAAPTEDTTTGATSTPAPAVMVTLASALGMAAHSTAATANATLSGGVRLHVRVAGEQGALVRSLGDSIGAYSPSRDGADPAAAVGGMLRAGLSLVLTADRPIVLTKLVLDSWDASDSASLVLDDDQGATRRKRAPSTVTIRDAESSFNSEMSRAATKFVLTANGETSEFSLKSIDFVPATATPAWTGASTDTLVDAAMLSSVGSPDPAALDTTAIALIAVGGAVLLIVAIVVVVCIVRRRGNKKSSATSSSSSSTPAGDEASGVPLQTVLVGNYGAASLPTTATMDTFATEASKSAESTEFYRQLDLSQPAPVYQSAPVRKGVAQPYVAASVAASETSGLYHPMTMEQSTQDLYQPLRVGAMAEAGDEAYVPVPPTAIRPH